MVTLTHDEMQKVAISIKNLEVGGNFLTKTMPNFFKSVRGGAEAIGLTAANANKAGLVGGAVGGAAGALSGNKDQNPETRGRSMLTRAAIGAAAGFYGGKGIANKMPTFGQHYEEAFKPVGTKMFDLAKNKNLGDVARGQKLTDFAAKQLNPQYSTGGIKGVKTKTFFNMGSETKATGLRKNPDLPWGAKVMGDLARGAKNMRTQGLFNGIGTTLKNNWEEAKTFDRKIDLKTGLKGNGNDPTFRFNRSAAGRIISPLATAGIGMGITDAALGTNDNGSKPTMSKRLRTGAKSTLAWGMAPHLMMGKMIGYDIPKTIMGGTKQPQQDLNTIGV